MLIKIPVQFRSDLFLVCNEKRRRERRGRGLKVWKVKDLRMSIIQLLLPDCASPPPDEGGVVGIED